MRMSQAVPSQELDGFAGAVAGMSLSDIIQVKGGNRYTGSLVVEHTGKSGTIFFLDGAVVHAKLDTLNGEDAFYAIMGWAGGTFRSEPKVVTTSRTINQSIGYLILEALRRIDEAGHNAPVSSKKEATAARGGESMSDINNKLKTIPKIEQAVIITKEGLVVDDTSYEADFLAAQGLFIAQFAGQLGSFFGLGELKAATVHGSEHHLFLFESKRHHLCVSAVGSANVNLIEAEIRRVLAQK